MRGSKKGNRKLSEKELKDKYIFNRAQVQKAIPHPVQPCNVEHRAQKRGNL